MAHGVANPLSRDLGFEMWDLGCGVGTAVFRFQGHPAITEIQSEIPNLKSQIRNRLPCHFRMKCASYFC